MTKTPADEMQRLWRYIIARYGALPVTWLVCGEYNQFNKPDIVRNAMATGRFIKRTDPYRRAMSIHPWYFRKEQRQAWAEPWYDFIMIQGGHRCYPGTEIYLKPYGSKSVKPLLECECNYEGIQKMTDADVRWAAYRAIQSGSFGYTYGSHGLWNASPTPAESKWGPATEWWVALARPGGEQMRHLRDCYESVDWWKLEPRPSAVSPQGGKRIHTKAESSRVFLVYFERNTDPKLKAILAGGDSKRVYRADWFDPRTGKRTKAARDLRMPDGKWALPDRPDGQDWMLIIEGQ
jgi:hypothetical protein